jgi:hypothetical protein
MRTNIWMYTTKLTVAFHSFENTPKTQNTHTLLIASKNDLGGNVVNTKYMFMSH